MKDSVKEIIYGIVELKQTVTGLYLSKPRSQDEDVKLETVADFKYYLTILK